MNPSLANLTHNLSEINNKDCKKCMEINKIKSACEYIDYKDNRLIYKCKKCNSKFKCVIWGIQLDYKKNSQKPNHC